uniref:Uncharacterized protein n=1 Tax=Moniliophthora roreri TaxID=221103 RepID=A0A0W0FS67_MONRR
MNLVKFFRINFNQQHQNLDSRLRDITTENTRLASTIEDFDKESRSLIAQIESMKNSHKKETAKLLRRAEDAEERAKKAESKVEEEAAELLRRAEDAEGKAMEKVKRVMEDVFGTVTKEFPSLSQARLSASPVEMRRSSTMPSPGPSKRMLKENQTPTKPAKKVKKEVTTPAFKRAGTSFGMSYAATETPSQRLGFSPHIARFTCLTPCPDSEDERMESQGMDELEMAVNMPPRKVSVSSSTMDSL